MKGLENETSVYAGKKLRHCILFDNVLLEHTEDEMDSLSDLMVRGMVIVE